MTDTKQKHLSSKYNTQDINRQKGFGDMEKAKVYYGWNDKENRVMFATITGEMNDGTKVYTECNENNELVNADKQYRRMTKYGTQCFFSL